MKNVFVFIASFVLLSSSARAQFPSPTQVTVRGEISRDGGENNWTQLTLELHSLTHARVPERIPVMFNGTFECRNIDTGDYELLVMDNSTGIIYRETIRVRETGAWLALRLPRREEAAPTTSAVVSVQRLLHPVPAKATREFSRASEASRAGDLSKSVQHLKKAISIYPDYMEAHNNLGVAYMNLRQFEKAEAEFRRAIALDSSTDKTHLNLGLTLVAVGRYAEAEDSIRASLKLSPRSIFTHYALGQVLFAEGKNTTETLDALRKSVDQFPLARLLVAHILLVRGEIPEAQAELRAYLDSGRPEKRQEVQTWLALLLSRKP